eukprot:g13874.t1
MWFQDGWAAAAAPPPAPRRVRTVPAAARALPALLRVSAGNRPDPLAQCLEFARWAKKKKIQGKELTKLFMSTCSAGAGAAPKKYVEMCQGVESVVTVLERQERVVGRWGGLRPSAIGSAGLGQCPPEDPRKPEFAFFGQSNVGKSTMLNFLCNRKKLSTISKHPGHTKLIHHFLCEKSFYLVDLPGTGDAEGSQ